MVVEVEAPSGFIVAMIMRFEACLQHFLFGRIEIRERLSKLPAQLTPTQQDWTRISKGLRQDLQMRIDVMTRMRDKLDGCIGCGCLSLQKCALYNPDDRANRHGPGPRYLLQEQPAPIREKNEVS